MAEKKTPFNASIQEPKKQTTDKKFVESGVKNIDEIRKSDAHPDVLEVYNELDRFKRPQQRQNWLDKRKECWKAIGENEFDTDEELQELKNNHQTDVVINKMAEGVQTSSAMVTDSKPEVKFLPLGESDLYVADLLKRANDLIWDKNNGNGETYNLVEECKTGGIDFFHGKYDPARGTFGRITFDAVKDVTNLYWDVDSEKDDFSDTSLILARRRTPRYIKDNYPGVTDEDLRFDPKPQSDPEVSEGITGGDNYAVNPEKSDHNLDQNKKNVWEIEAWLLKTIKAKRLVFQTQEDLDEGRANVQIRELPKTAEGQTEEQLVESIKAENGLAFAEVLPVTMKVREMSLVVGKKMIFQKVNPYGTDSDGDSICGLIGLKHNRTLTAYPTCPSFKAYGTNRSLNKRNRQFIYAASAEYNSPIVRSQHDKWNGAPGGLGSELVMAKDAPFPPFRLSHNGVSMNAFISLVASDNQTIENAYNINDVLRGQTPKGVENPSGRLVLALQDFGTIPNKPFLRALEYTLTQLGKLDVVLAMNHWPREQWERLLDPTEMLAPPPGEEPPEGLEQDVEAQKEFKNKWLNALNRIRPLNPTEEPGVSMLDVDVKITAGSSLPTNRMAKAAFAIEMAGAGVYDAEAVLEAIDDPNKDKVLERIKNRPPEQPKK